MPEFVIQNIDGAYYLLRRSCCGPTYSSYDLVGIFATEEEAEFESDKLEPVELQLKGFPDGYFDATPAVLEPLRKRA